MIEGIILLFMLALVGILVKAAWEKHRPRALRNSPGVLLQQERQGPVSSRRVWLRRISMGVMMIGPLLVLFSLLPEDKPATLPCGKGGTIGCPTLPPAETGTLPTEPSGQGTLLGLFKTAPENKAATLPAEPPVKQLEYEGKPFLLKVTKEWSDWYGFAKLPSDRKIAHGWAKPADRYEIETPTGVYQLIDEPGRDNQIPGYIPRARYRSISVKTNEVFVDFIRDSDIVAYKK